MTRHSSRTRGLAALVVVAFLGSSLASYIHNAVETHARCPEHGEIIHVRGELAQAPASAPATPSTGDHASPGSSDDGHHDHDHCYLCPNTRERLGAAAAVTTLIGAQPILPGYTAGVVAAPVRSELYILAPKTSPPA